MLRFELRKMFRPNGLIDDVVVFGMPNDYVYLSQQTASAVVSPAPIVLRIDPRICVEISRDDNHDALFTSLQNETDEYFSLEDWNNRSILRVIGSERTLTNLSVYLLAVSARGAGYSYISEFTEAGEYSDQSPEWRLHVESEVVLVGH